LTRESGWQALPPQFDPEAATLLAECPALGSPAQAAEALSASRTRTEDEVYGWLEGDQLVAVYGLRRSRLHVELLWLAIAPEYRGKRYGRSALVDALRRCGRKPMTVEADGLHKGWFEAIGFRLVGRRATTDGGFRYRLGWYAPRLPQEAGYGAHGQR
jgi:GNAT superfamily N-acetyltransferase